MTSTSKKQNGTNTGQTTGQHYLSIFYKILGIFYCSTWTTSFQFIVGVLIFDIVTIKRNHAVLQRYENNHCITTTKLRSSI
jgi:hypothetical protein